MRVGTSATSFITSEYNEDHPHACGDKSCFVNSHCIDSGSSPCVWGQEHRILAHTLHNRIIPMRVGTRYRQRDNEFSREDHPHACGDKYNCPYPHLQGSGSSPCVWGQDVADDFKAIAGRIIPMRVGTSLLTSALWDSLRDHPHACGDKVYFVIFALDGAGSSPCVWGQATATGTDTRTDKDHPHACGDKEVFTSRFIVYIGSSPCVWGQVIVMCSIVKPSRIIPMRVGTSRPQYKNYR